MSYLVRTFIFCIPFLVAAGCGGGGGGGNSSGGGNCSMSSSECAWFFEHTYDTGVNGTPVVATSNYIDPSKIAKISKFRAIVGHDNSDDFETCRTMKHYFWPKGGAPGETHNPSWGAIEIKSPVDGTIQKVYEEWAGTQLWIRSTNNKAVFFIIYHVNKSRQFVVGDAVVSGEVIGTHIGDQTMSDIEVAVATPNGRKNLSFFEVMDDSVFSEYQAAANISSRGELILTKEYRDAFPVDCVARGQYLGVSPDTYPDTYYDLPI